MAAAEVGVTLVCMDAVIATDRLTKRDGAARETGDVSIEVAPGEVCLAAAGPVLLIIGAILTERHGIRH